MAQVAQCCAAARRAADGAGHHAPTSTALHLPGGRSAATTYLLHSSIFHVAVVKCSLPLSLSATTRHYDRCAVSGR